VIYIGYFLLGFIVFFVGGLYYLSKWEIFDMVNNDDEDVYLG
jgi:hypothetical protein